MKNIIIGAGICGINVIQTHVENFKMQLEVWSSGNLEDFKHDNSKENFFDEKSNFYSSSKLLFGDNFENLNLEINEIFKIPSKIKFLEKNNEFLNNNIELISSKLFSGLGNKWGANCLPYNIHDIYDWDIDKNRFIDEIHQISNRFRINRVEDDLNKKFDIKAFGTENNFNLDPRDNFIFQNYKKKIKFSDNFAIGKSRLAIRNNHYEKCLECCKCIWGCPVNLIYDPKLEFKNILEKEKKKLNYRENVNVDYFVLKDKKVTEIVYKKNEKYFSEKINGKIFLSTGAINSYKIIIKTLIKNNIDINKFDFGFMDTLTTKIVYILPWLIGNKLTKNNIQYNRLIAGLLYQNSLKNYIHLEILNLTSLNYTPIINTLPFSMRFSKELFYKILPSLGALTIFSPDRLNNSKTIKVKNLNNYEINYQLSKEDKDIKSWTIKEISKKLIKLGAIPLKVINFKTGSGIHYAGTMPMGKKNSITNNNGKTVFAENLFIADSSIYPSLPSKPISMNAAALGSMVVKNAE